MSFCSPTARLHAILSRTSSSEISGEHSAMKRNANPRKNCPRRSAITVVPANAVDEGYRYLDRSDTEQRRTAELMRLPSVKKLEAAHRRETARRFP